MNSLTTFDTISFLDVACLISAGKLSSTHAFLLEILDQPYDAQITSEHLQKAKYELNQGENILNFIRLSQLTKNEIVKNIEKNLIEQCCIDVLDYELIKLIEDSENLNNQAKTDLLGASSFSERIYNSLMVSLVNQIEDRKIIAKINFEAKNSFFTELKNNCISIIANNTALQYENINKTFTLLKTISNEYLEDLTRENGRFCGSIDEDLLLEYNFLPELDNNRNLFIIGKSGFGKTTALINFYKCISLDEKYIPMYIPLNSIHLTKDNKSSLIKEYIINNLIKEYFFKCANKSLFSFTEQETALEDALEFKQTDKNIILLLDGFNELSCDSNSLIKEKLYAEIESLSLRHNLRIVLTSQPFEKSADMFVDFKHITIDALCDDTVNRYLFKNNVPYVSDMNLKLIISNPLFLKMYVTNYKKGLTSASTCGAILYDYFNSNSSNISDQLLLIHETRNSVKKNKIAYTNLIFSLVLPTLAAYMSLNGLYGIPISKLRKVLVELDPLAKILAQNKDEWFNQHCCHCNTSFLLSELQDAGINFPLMLTDSFPYIHIDVSGKLFFTHEYIKYYFEALFYILALRSGLDSKINMFYWSITNTPINKTVIKFMYEISMHSSLLNIDMLKAYLKPSSLLYKKIFLSNLLDTISVFNDNSLAELIFKDINFATCKVSLPQYKFSKDGKTSSFINCDIDTQSLLNFDTTHHYLKCYSFFDGNPVLCEITINQYDTFFKIIDMKSKAILLLENLTKLCTAPNSLVGCNKIKISPDFNYIVFFDDSFLDREFYIYDRTKCRFAIHFLPGGTELVGFHFDRDLLFAIVNDEQLLTYDMSYFGDYDAPISIQEIDGTLICNDKYEGLIDTINIDSSLFVHEDDRVCPNYQNLYFVKNKIFVVYNSYAFEDTLLVIDRETHESSLITNTLQVQSNFDCIVSSSLYLDKLYFTFADTLYVLDTQTYAIEEIVNELDIMPFFTELVVNSDGIFLYTNGKIKKWSLEGYYLSELLVPDYTPNSYMNYLGKHYVLIDMSSSNFEYAFLLRSDLCEFVHFFNYGKFVSLVNVIYLRERILMTYSNGYVALLNKDLALIKTFTLKPNQQLINLAHCPQNDYIAVLVKTTDYDKEFLTVYIISIEDDKLNVLNTIDNIYHQNAITYSKNGLYLITHSNNAINVYTTKDYSLRGSITLCSEVSLLRAYENNKLLVFSFTKPTRNCSGYDVSIIDILDMSIVSSSSIPNMDYYDLRKIGNSGMQNISCIAPGIYKVNGPEMSNESIGECFIHAIGDADLVVNMCNHYQNEYECIGSLSEGNIYPSSPENMIKAKSIYPWFSKFDKINNVYYYVTDSNAIEKLDINTGISARSSFIPGLRIEGCKFVKTHRLEEPIKSILIANLGIIENGEIQ